MRPSADKSTVIPSKEKAEILLRAALSKKALDPVLLRLDGLTSLTDYFLIVSAKSHKQVSAIAEAVMEDGRKHLFERYSTEGVSAGNWALLDYGDVIVHIFHTPVREFYDLEGLWYEAPVVMFSGDLYNEITLASQPDDEEDEDELD